MRARNKCLVFGSLALVALGLGLWLRVEDSLRRVYHADEGVQSYQAWRLIEEGEYRYDPNEHHGPLLYYVTRWMYPIIHGGDEVLSDAEMRRVPALFSMAMIVFGVVAFWRYGPAEASIWSLLAAVTPLSVIYGSYYVQESMIACFTVTSVYFAFRYWREPSRKWALWIGVAIGLMHVTKETAVLHIVALLGAMAIVAIASKASRAALVGRLQIEHLVLAFLPVAVLHVVFFSSLFSNPQGIWDGIATFFSYAERSQGQGHEKPFWYYVSLLWPRKIEGVRWGELGLLVSIALGCAGVARNAFRQPSERASFHLLLAVFGILLVLLYSIIPYKNPWLLLTPLVVLSYSAACGLVLLVKETLASRGPRRVAMAAVSAVLLVWVLSEERKRVESAVFLYPSASRNPYLYSHTTPRYSKLLERFEALPSKDVSIGVYSPDAAWPLPWHLRNWPKVGYWTSLETFTPHSIDIIDTRLTGDSVPKSAADDFWELHGLRPNTLLAVRSTRGIAENWIRKE